MSHQLWENLQFCAGTGIIGVGSSLRPEDDVSNPVEGSAKGGLKGLAQ